MMCFTEGEKLSIKERERLKPLNSLMRHGFKKDELVVEQMQRMSVWIYENTLE